VGIVFSDNREILRHNIDETAKEVYMFERGDIVVLNEVGIGNYGQQWRGFAL
jgi:hypothetical protein